MTPALPDVLESLVALRVASIPEIADRSGWAYETTRKTVAALCDRGMAMHFGRTPNNRGALWVITPQGLAHLLAHERSRDA